MMMDSEAHQILMALINIHNVKFGILFFPMDNAGTVLQNNVTPCPCVWNYGHRSNTLHPEVGMEWSGEGGGRMHLLGF